MTRQGKLCTITDTSEVRTLSENPTVSCGLCGAKSHDPGNLCDPVQLPEPGHLGD